MKKLLLSLIVLTVFASCGKDNKVASSNNTNSDPYYSPITTETPGASQLASQIDNYQSSFGTGQVYYYGNMQTLGTLANTGLNIVYRYTKSAGTSVGSNCEVKWNIFTVCKSSSVAKYGKTVTESRSDYNNAVNIADKIRDLKIILNNSNPLIAIKTQGTANLIVTKDGTQYIIDTSFPLQANPIGIRNSSGTEYLYNITEN